MQVYNKLQNFEIINMPKLSCQLDFNLLFEVSPGFGQIIYIDPLSLELQYSLVLLFE
jgi:hypothetical protein